MALVSTGPLAPRMEAEQDLLSFVRDESCYSLDLDAPEDTRTLECVNSTSQKKWFTFSAMRLEDDERIGHSGSTRSGYQVFFVSPRSKKIFEHRVKLRAQPGAIFIHREAPSVATGVIQILDWAKKPKEGSKPAHITTIKCNVQLPRILPSLFAIDVVYKELCCQGCV